MMKTKKYRKPLKRYTRRAVRKQSISRSLADSTPCKVESYYLLRFNPGNPSLVETATGDNFITIAKALGSYSFLQMHTDWQRYKITGIALRASDVQTTENPTFSNGAPVTAIAFYPNQSGTNLGNIPIFNDNKMYVEPNVGIPQNKYWRFPNNYFPGNGVGFGTWNNCTNYLNQEGQISFANTTTTSPSLSITIISLRITIYVIFNTKNY